MGEAPSAADVPRETWSKLRELAEMVTEWNGALHLVSKGDTHRVMERHIQDSLALLPFLGSATTPADLGSGGGFPGLVLAIAAARRFTLIEANQRKAAFLREAARRTETPVNIYTGRIEAMTERFDLMTARAVAPLPALLELAHPRLAAGARCLFPKGQGSQVELAAAERDWAFDVAIHPSRTDANGCILEIANIHARAAP